MHSVRARSSQKAPARRRRRHSATADATLAALAQGQHGLFTTAQARKAGCSRSAIAHRLRAGRWVRRGRGVYAIAGAPLTKAQQVMAAVLAAGAGAVAAGTTAAELWGLPEIWTRTTPQVHVPHRARRAPKGVKLRRVAHLDAGQDTAVHDGIPVTTALRTLIDLAATLPRKALELAIMDALRRKLMDADAFVAAVNALPGQGRKGVEKLRAIIACEAFRLFHRSRMEAMAIVALTHAGLPAPKSNHELDEGQVFLGERDLVYLDQKIVIEIDGGTHDETTRREKDRQIDRDLVAAGYLIFRPRWLDLTARKDAFVAKVVAAYQQRSKSPPRPNWRLSAPIATSRPRG